MMETVEIKNVIGEAVTYELSPEPIKPLDCGHQPTSRCHDCKQQVVVRRARKLLSGNVPFNYGICSTEGCRHVFHFFDQKGATLRLEHEHKLDVAWVQAKGWQPRERETWAGKETLLEICKECQFQLPTTVRKRAIANWLDYWKEANAILAELEALSEAAAKSDATELYLCSGCGGYIEKDDLVQVRQCSKESCDESTFDGTENGRNCPDCNSPFSRKLTELGCAQCLEEDECELVHVEARLAELNRQKAWAEAVEAQATALVQEYDRDHGFTDAAVK